MSDKPEQCPFCGGQRDQNPNGHIWICGSYQHGREPHQSDLCSEREDRQQLETELAEVRGELQANRDALIGAQAYLGLFRRQRDDARWFIDAAMSEVPCCANLGSEILTLLRFKANAKWEYYNPHFLLAITEQIEAHYKVTDDVVDKWVEEMFSA